MMLTPWGPSAVPTGGAGFACPAGTCNFTTATIGLAIGYLTERPRAADSHGPVVGSMRLQLQIVELDRRRPPEQRDRHPDLPLVRQHLFHGAAEIRERPFGDLHHVADEERNLLGRLLFAHRFLDAEEAVHLVGPQRHRLAPRADEFDHALDAVDGVVGLLVLGHLHQHVSRVGLPLHRDLLAVLDLHHFLSADRGLSDRLLGVGARVIGDAPRNERADLVLVSGRGLHGIPAMLGHQSSRATVVTSRNWSAESIRPITRPSSDTKMTMTRVAFRNSSRVGQVTLRISPRTSRRNSTTRASQPRAGPATTSVATATSIPCAAGAYCTAGNTSSTPPAPDASAGSWS